MFSLNFDSVKEILKILCQIYVLMKKVIILRKIQVTMKTFAPPFFNHFSLSLNRKKRVVMRVMRKKLNIFTLQLTIYCILEQKISIGANAGISKTKREKQIVFLVERWMQCLLLRLKSWSVREESHHPVFLGHCPTIVIRLSLVYLVDKFFFLFLVQLNKIRTLGEPNILSFCSWC